MNELKGKKSIIILFALSITLMSLAFVTVTSTFAIPENTKVSSWNIMFSNPKLTSIDNNSNINVNNDNIDFHILLKEFGDSFSFTTEIINSGSYNAYLSNINKTNLSEIIVGESDDTGNTYYVSDYISYTVKYLNNNKNNNILIGSSLKRGDKLMKNTKNSIIVTIRYKELDELTKDQIEVLNNSLVKTNIDGVDYLSFELDLNLNIIYQQLK